MHTPLTVLLATLYQAFFVSQTYSAPTTPALSQQQEQVLRDRLFQTNLRGPRWTGNDNQNVLIDLVASSMSISGLNVETLNYTLNRWDPRWWSLTLHLKNGTDLGLPTTGYWPYSGDSGLSGVTAAMHDAGTFGLHPNQTRDPSTLDLKRLPRESILFFDNPSPTRSYLAPGYELLGTSRNIPVSDIPEIGNLTNPHWQSEKTLDFAELKRMGVKGVVASWVHTSDENGALQFLPNDGAPGNGSVYEVPSLYVGNSTGELIRSLIRSNEVDTATVVLDAPSFLAPTKTVIGHLRGRDTSGNSTILLYTHSDGPSIIEENGPILLLTMAEYFARNRLNISLDVVITTGHMSGGHLDETLWMSERPAIRRTAKAAIVCEHFGAIEWKDNFDSGKPVYEATGQLEPMWTMANSSSRSDLLHQLYLDAFEGTPDNLRMALLSPQTVNGVRSRWYGAGGSGVLGRSNLPTIGIIPQPDYLWASMPDGGWSKLDMDTAIAQINVILRLITSLDEKYSAGQL